MSVIALSPWWMGLLDGQASPAGKMGSMGVYAASACSLLCLGFLLAWSLADAARRVGPFHRPNQRRREPPRANAHALSPADAPAMRGASRLLSGIDVRLRGRRQVASESL